MFSFHWHIHSPDGSCSLASVSVASLSSLPVPNLSPDVFKKGIMVEVGLRRKKRMECTGQDNCCRFSKTQKTHNKNKKPLKKIPHTGDKNHAQVRHESCTSHARVMHKSRTSHARVTHESRTSHTRVTHESRTSHARVMHESRMSHA